MNTISYTIRTDPVDRLAEMILMRRLIETYHDWAVEDGRDVPEHWRDRHLDRPCFWHSLLEALMGPETLSQFSKKEGPP